MKTEVLTPMESANLGSPTTDSSSRFHLDRKIRSLGYAIHARPKDREAIWMRTKDRKTFTETEVKENEGLFFYD